MPKSNGRWKWEWKEKSMESQVRYWWMVISGMFNEISRWKTKKNKLNFQCPIFSNHLKKNGTSIHHFQPTEFCPTEWGSWQEWGECSSSCDGGHVRRKRKCHYQVNFEIICQIGCLKKFQLKMFFKLKYRLRILSAGLTSF